MPAAAASAVIARDFTGALLPSHFRYSPKLTLPQLKLIALLFMSMGHWYFILEFYGISYAFHHDLQMPFLVPELAQSFRLLSQVSMPLLFFLTASSVASRNTEFFKTIVKYCVLSAAMYGVVSYFDHDLLLPILKGNFFIDLLMLNLIYFFLYSYQPFADRRSASYSVAKRAAFRSIALLPAAYVAGCCAVTVLSGENMLDIPWWARGFLISKGIQNYIFFFIFITLTHIAKRIWVRKYGVTFARSQLYLSYRNVLAVAALAAVTVISAAVGSTVDGAEFLFKDYSHAVYAAPLFLMFNGECEFRTVWRQIAMYGYYAVDIAILINSLFAILNSVLMV